MEHHHINKDKIIEAFYLKPYEPDSEMPFGEKQLKRKQWKQNTEVI